MSKRMARTRPKHSQNSTRKRVIDRTQPSYCFMLTDFQLETLVSKSSLRSPTLGCQKFFHQLLIPVRLMLVWKFQQWVSRKWIFQKMTSSWRCAVRRSCPTWSVITLQLICSTASLYGISSTIRWSMISSYSRRLIGPAGASPIPSTQDSKGTR